NQDSENQGRGKGRGQGWGGGQDERRRQGRDNEFAEAATVVGGAEWRGERKRWISSSTSGQSPPTAETSDPNEDLLGSSNGLSSSSGGLFKNSFAGMEGVTDCAGDRGGGAGGCAGSDSGDELGRGGLTPRGDPPSPASPPTTRSLISTGHS
ncbi:unnamed protein product, partial [Choristocarpus tenellus]